MFPPDDDYLEDRSESNSEPEEAEMSAALAAIPVDLYEQLMPLLQLCAVANFLLLGRAADPVPQAIEQLTSFDLAAARQVSWLRDSAGVGRLLLRQPERFFDFIMLGQLTFASPLFASVCQLLPAATDEDGDVAEHLRDFVVESGENIIGNLSEYLTYYAPALNQDWHLRRLQLESIFARLEDTLIPTPLPQAEAELGAPTAPVRLQINFPAAQLVALQLALALPEQLAHDTDEPFVRAVVALPGLAPAAARDLRQRLAQLCPTDRLPLTLNELCLLYQAAQVCALALVGGALDDLAGPGGPVAVLPTPAHCAELERFVQLVQTNFPHEPVLVAARRAVEALAKLL